MPTEATTGKAFMRAVAAALGIDPTDTSVQKQLRLRLDPAWDQSQINKWWNGKQNPSFQPTMFMLGRLGWLTPEARRFLSEASLAESAERTAAAERALRRATGPRRRPKTGEQR